MKPDVYTQLEFVNATGNALVVSSSPPPSVPAFHAYQMASWFTFPGAAPSPVAASAGTATYRIQFQRGVGDNTDAADLVVSLGAGGPNLFHLYAGSAANSAHYLQVMPLAPSSSKPIPGSQVVVGVSPSQIFEQSSPGSLRWSLINSGQLPVPLNLVVPTAPSAPQALVIADLSILYDPTTAAGLISAIGDGLLTEEEMESLYAQVTGYCFPAATSLSYELTQIDFPSAPPLSAGTSAVLGQTTATVESASLEVTVDLDQSLTDSFTLTSQQTWGIGVEIPFQLGFKFVPSITVKGNFESQNGEAASVQQGASFGTSATMTMPAPGTYEVTATALIAQNYTTSFTGTLQVTGMASMPQSTAYPLTGTLLALLLAPRSPRNGGLNAGPITPGPNLVTVPVNGTFMGTFGYELELSQSTVSTTAGSPSTGTPSTSSPAPGGQPTPATGGPQTGTQTKNITSISS